MKRKQVEMLFVDETKRKRKIMINIAIISFLIGIAFVFLAIFINVNKPEYVKYTEKSSLNYKVFLNKNQFFKKDYLENDNQYISSLIKNVKANFDYKLNIQDSAIDYKYEYRIVADATVKDKKTNKNLYRYKETLKEEDYKTSTGTTLNINESLDIDYNKYNNLIKKFVNIYGLNDSVATLNVNMYVGVLGDCEESENLNDESVIKLSIPLNTSTVSIDTIYDLNDNADVKLLKCSSSEGGIFYLLLSISFVIASVFIIIRLIKYVVSTRTAESIYNIELKKILNSYRSYIQKINNEFDLKGYQLLRVDEFTDMLEIRDTINEPILMVENEKKDSVFFIIPSKTKLLYVYSLKVKDIKKKMEAKNEK